MSESKRLRIWRPWILGVRCSECPKIFRRRDNLTRHMRVHRHRFLECPDCKKSFSSGRSDSLKRHRATACHKLVDEPLASFVKKKQ